MTTTRQAIIVAAMFATLALGVLSPSLLRADQAADKARAILIWGDTTASSGGTSPAIPAPVTVAPHDDTATVQAHIRPPAPVVIKAAPQPAVVKKNLTTQRGPHWTHPMADTKAELIAHLLSDGVHRGRHTRAELQSMSYADLERIHDADHNANRAVRVTAPADCPNCNNPRRGLFGWRR